MGTPGGTAPKRPWSSRRSLLFATGLASTLLLGVGGGVVAVSAYEFVVGGVPRVEKFATGELQRERLARGESRGPEGFLLALGFLLGGTVGLLGWRWGARRLGVSSDEIDKALR